MLPTLGVISMASVLVSAWGAPFVPSGPASAEPTHIFGRDPTAPNVSVDKEIIRRIIRRHVDEVKSCYEPHLAKQPELAGKITVQFSINASGKVVSSVLQASTMNNGTVETCIVSAVRGWDFPKPLGGGIVVITYPFTLSPAAGGEGSGGPAPEDAILLGPGTPAPDFTVVAHDGQTVTLSRLRGKQVVLYFYPQDDSSGCTKEACEFRDRWADLRKAGVLVFGVSTQGNASHQAFAQKYTLPFPLLPDESGALAAKYFVPVVNGRVQRVTYLIGKDGRVQHVWPQVDPVGHAQDVMNHLGSR